MRGRLLIPNQSLECERLEHTLEHVRHPDHALNVCPRPVAFFDLAARFESACRTPSPCCSHTPPGQLRRTFDSRKAHGTRRTAASHQACQPPRVARANGKCVSHRERQRVLGYPRRARYLQKRARDRHPTGRLLETPAGFAGHAEVSARCPITSDRILRGRLPNCGQLRLNRGQRRTRSKSIWSRPKLVLGTECVRQGAAGHGWASEGGRGVRFAAKNAPFCVRRPLRRPLRSPPSL
jgi:hypothetical protein